MTISLGKGGVGLSALSNLSEVDSALGRVFERLSSGQRINRASDDAAGLAISEALKTDEKVYGQAIRNLNDGVSLLSVTDAALGELASINSRLVELAQQAASGSYSDEQRAALDNEAQELSKEFTRIIQSTEFNGIGVLNGGLEQGIALQGGYGTEGALVGTVGNYLGNGLVADDGAEIAYSVTYSDQTRAMADLNGDGILDMVGGGENGIDILIGAGDGSFSSSNAVAIAGTSAVYDIEFSDFNGDGNIDFVVAGSTGRSTNAFFQIFTGDGDGNFTAGASYTGDSGAFADVEVADLNGDGFVDVVAGGLAGTDNSGMEIRYGNGDGTLGSEVQEGALSSTDLNGVSVFDIDGDGDLDIVGLGDAGGAGKAVFRYNNGDGTFIEEAGTISATDDYTAMLEGDVNNDGIIDIVGIAQSGTGSYAITYLGDGTGSFTDVGSTNLGAVAIDTADLVDMNGDGFLDLASQNANFTAVLGDGQGGFNEGVGEQVVGYEGAADFNGDGIYDYLTNTGVKLGQSRGGINPILEFSLETQTDAQQALSQFQNKLDLISEQRGIVGAMQSRLPTAINVLQANTENSAAARSRITDADIAEETSQLLSYQIRQQAISSVLAQANQSADVVLGLLGISS